MLVKIKENFKLANYSSNTALKKNKIYSAIIASNIPKYKENGLIFVENLLLDKNDYIIVK